MSEGIGMGLSDYERYGSAVTKLKNAMHTGTVPHAYIFEGDHNTDKLGLSIAFAQALLCAERPGEGCGQCPTCRKLRDGNYEDFYLVQPKEKAEGKTGTRSLKDADIEFLQQKLMEKPSAGDRNIAVISGADTMTLRAETRLLKTLEEPAPGTVILLLSENSEKLLPTIRSRCVTIRLVNLTEQYETPMEAFASEILEMVLSNAFFFDVQKKISKKVKSRNDAYEFLDGMESVLESCLAGGGKMPSASAAKGIQDVEEARRMLQQNVIPRFSVLGLILKLES
ncbi:MAG: DNA polymerase III subunit [Eubacteriales bacterium]|nr:DNA polymerase III subunit [Eubacteriales bacterium]